MSDEISLLEQLKPLEISQQWEYTSPLIACRFDPQGRYLLAAAQDSKIVRWDLADESRSESAGHDSWCRAIGFSEDGRQAYTGAYDGVLAIWRENDNKQLELRQRIEAHQGWIRALDVDWPSNTIATAGNDHVVRLWNAGDGSAVAEFAGHESHVYSLLFVQDGSYLLSGDLAGRILQHDVKTGKVAREIDAGPLHTYHGGQNAHYGGVRSMSLRSGRLACGGLHKATNPFGAVQEPLVVVFDWESGEQVQTHTAKDISRGICWRVLHMNDHVLLGASGGGSGGHLLFWTPEQESEAHGFRLPNTILDMDLHPDGRQILTAHHDKKVRITSPKQ